jgi:hypothetical protein
LVKTSLTVHLAKKNCPLSINFIYVIIHEHAILDDVNKHEHTILDDVNKHEHTILNDVNKHEHTILNDVNKHEHTILDDVNKHEHTILNDVNKHEHTILDDYNLTYNSDVYTMYAMRQEKFLDEDFNTVADLSKK